MHRLASSAWQCSSGGSSISGVTTHLCLTPGGNAFYCTELRDMLVAPPAKAAAAESQGEKRVGELVSALESKQLFSRKQLAAQWGQNPDYLRPELASWLRKVCSNWLSEHLTDPNF